MSNKVILFIVLLVFITIVGTATKQKEESELNAKLKENFGNKYKIYFDNVEEVFEDLVDELKVNIEAEADWDLETGCLKARNLDEYGKCERGYIPETYDNPGNLVNGPSKKDKPQLRCCVFDPNSLVHPDDSTLEDEQMLKTLRLMAPEFVLMAVEPKLGQFTDTFMKKYMDPVNGAGDDAVKQLQRNYDADLKKPDAQRNMRHLDDVDELENAKSLTRRQAQRAAIDAQEKATREVGERLARESAEKAAKMFSNKMAKNIAKKMVKQTIRAITWVGAKMTMMLQKMGMASSMGPLGVAWMIFEMFSMVADMTDPMGYAEYLSQGHYIKTRNQFEYQQWLAATEANAKGFDTMYPAVANDRAFLQYQLHEDAKQCKWEDYRNNNNNPIKVGKNKNIPPPQSTPQSVNSDDLCPSHTNESIAAQNRECADVDLSWCSAYDEQTLAEIYTERFLYQVMNSGDLDFNKLFDGTVSENDQLFGSEYERIFKDGYEKFQDAIDLVKNAIEDDIGLKAAWPGFDGHNQAIDEMLVADAENMSIMDFTDMEDISYTYQNHPEGQASLIDQIDIEQYKIRDEVEDPNGEVFYTSLWKTWLNARSENISNYFMDYLTGTIGKRNASLLETVDFKKATCDMMNKIYEKDNLGFRWKYVENHGCTLDEEGCSRLKAFNETMLPPVPFNVAEGANPESRTFPVREYVAWTKYYRVPNGPNQNPQEPNMMVTELPEPMCLTYGSTYFPENKEECETPGNLFYDQKGLWNDDINLCNFNEDYCVNNGMVKQHMTVDYDGRIGWQINTCKTETAHMAAEFIFGKTVTSHFSKWGTAWTDPDTWSAENAFGFKAVLAMHCDMTWMMIGTVIGFQKHLWSVTWRGTKRIVDELFDTYGEGPAGWFDKCITGWQDLTVEEHMACNPYTVSWYCMYVFLDEFTAGYLNYGLTWMGDQLIDFAKDLSEWTKHAIDIVKRVVEKFGQDVGEAIMLAGPKCIEAVGVVVDYMDQFAVAVTQEFVDFGNDIKKACIDQAGNLMIKTFSDVGDFAIQGSDIFMDQMKTMVFESHLILKDLHKVILQEPLKAIKDIFDVHKFANVLQNRANEIRNIMFALDDVLNIKDGLIEIGDWVKDIFSF